MFFSHKKESPHSHALSRFFDAHLWKALVVVPLAMVFGQVASLPIINWSYEVTLAEIIIGAVFTLWAAHMLSREGRRELVVPRIGKHLLLLVGLIVLSGMWAGSIEKWMIALRVICFQFAMFFLTVNLINARERAVVALKWFLGFAVLASISILIAVIPIPYNELVTLNRAWITTPMGALSYVAALVALSAPLVMGGYYLVNTTRWRVAVSFVYVMVVVSLLYAAGKAAMLSALAGLVVVFASVRQRRWYFLALTITGLAIFAVLSTSTQGGFGSYTIQRLTQTTVDNSTQFRLLELHSAGAIIHDHLLIGTGWGNMKEAYLQQTGFYEGDANNIFIQIIGELGVLGLIIFILIISQLVRMLHWGEQSIVKKIPVIPALYIAFFVTAAINAMFEVTIIGLFYGILFWYLAGIFYTLYNEK